MRHEQTIVYKKSLALMEAAQSAIEQFPRGFAFLVDQLRRNTSSVHHNFAEGYYQDSRRQQRRYFGYAIQSAREASASFDAALAFRAAEQETVARGKGLALELVRMLSKFSRPRGGQDSETVISTPSHQGSGSQVVRLDRASNDSG